MTQVNVWHVVVNPASGNGLALQFASEVERRLNTANIPFQTHSTQHEGDGYRVGLSLGSSIPIQLNDRDDDHAIFKGQTIVCIIGGDGTLHEVLNGLQSAAKQGQHPPAYVNFVLIPAGTANAYYHSLFHERYGSANTAGEMYRWYSLDAALSGDVTASRPNLPLTLLQVDVIGEAHQPGGPSAPKERYYAHVVTSTALHAALLQTASSREMRQKHPGTERFRLAAQMHAGTVYEAAVKLLPTGSTQTVQKYNAREKKWESMILSPSDVSAPGKSVDTFTLPTNSFTYFVSALIDRFEENFVIAPLSSPSQRPSDAVDILFVRAMDNATKEEEGQRLFTILNAAFENGQHVNLAEISDGSLVMSDAGDHVAEYYRCGGFAWKPVSFAMHNIASSEITD
ncbi:hypothetical protein EMMF5_000990 [Cystobasidiomycetes sp. EMM_F5]